MRRLLWPICFAICFVVWALASSQPALALEDCFADSLGPWRGPVLDSGRLRVMDSEFHLDAAGALVGSYHLGLPQTYDGTLDGFRQTDACEAEFRWHDPFGSGVVRVRFRPERGRFDGLWGGDTPLAGHFFDGRRVVAAPLS